MDDDIMFIRHGDPRMKQRHAALGRARSRRQRGLGEWEQKMPRRGVD